MSEPCPKAVVFGRDSNQVVDHTPVTTVVKARTRLVIMNEPGLTMVHLTHLVPEEINALEAIYPTTNRIRAIKIVLTASRWISASEKSLADGFFSAKQGINSSYVQPLTFGR